MAGQYNQYFHIRTTAENGAGYEGISCGYETPMKIQDVTLSDPGPVSPLLYNTTPFIAPSWIHLETRQAVWIEDDCMWSPVTGSAPFETNVLVGTEQGLDIYPNPTKSELTLNLSGSAGSARVLCIDGKEVIKSFQLAEGKSKIYVDELPVGFYFVEVQTQDGLFVQKFMKE